MWTVRKSIKEDVQSLKDRLRPEDVAEVLASSGQDPETVLSLSMTLPSFNGCWTICWDDNPEMMFGCTLIEGRPDIGVPWALGTNRIKKNTIPLLRITRRWVEGFSRQFPLLMNFVHAKNTYHIKWLEWCGFEMVKLHESYGVGQEPFWEFRIEKEV